MLHWIVRVVRIQRHVATICLGLWLVAWPFVTTILLGLLNSNGGLRRFGLPEYHTVSEWLLELFVASFFGGIAVTFYGTYRWLRDNWR